MPWVVDTGSAGSFPRHLAGCPGLIPLLHLCGGTKQNSWALIHSQKQIYKAHICSEYTSLLRKAIEYIGPCQLGLSCFRQRKCSDVVRYASLLRYALKTNQVSQPKRKVKRNICWWGLGYFCIDCSHIYKYGISAGVDIYFMIYQMGFIHKIFLSIKKSRQQTILHVEQDSRE